MKKRKKVFLIPLGIILFYFIFNLIVFPPVKRCIFPFELKNESREYIICDYIETTGFWWRSGKEYIKLESDLSDDEFMDVFSDELTFESGADKFVFYGKFADYDLGEEFNKDMGSDYRVFTVEDWDIIAPLNLRFYSVLGIPMIAPPWLTSKDITTN